MYKSCDHGWVAPRAGLDGCGKSRHHRVSIPGPSSPQPVAIPTTLPGSQFFPNNRHILVFVMEKQCVYTNLIQIHIYKLVKLWASKGY